MIIFQADRKPKTMGQDDTSTLISAALEDPAAFGRLYDRYVQPIYRYVFSRVGSTHEAEDITSQTFMTAYESLPKYRERGYFSAWLFRIAQSKMNDHFRRSRREVGLEAAAELMEREDSLGALIRAEELSQIRFLIKKLNPEEQDLIRLRYVADLSFVEMAELLGKREDAVKKSFYRLLERLKGQME
ncbi:MAG: sigma-70 family RNA polymerase sigma factor [Anaerolineales bacterium]